MADTKMNYLLNIKHINDIYTKNYRNLNSWFIGVK